MDRRVVSGAEALDGKDAGVVSAFMRPPHRAIGTKAGGPRLWPGVVARLPSISRAAAAPPT